MAHLWLALCVTLLQILVTQQECHCACASQRGKPLSINGFNIQVFGKTKLNKVHDDGFEVAPILVKILRDYDITLIQEIRDSSETALPALVDMVNDGLPEEEQYDYVISERLGRTSSKEQYCYLYRKSRVSITDTYQYEDPNDDFQREPFCVKVSSPDTSVKEFFMVGCHTAPEEADHEINALRRVYDEAAKKFGLEDGIVFGDLNAGCDYVKKKEWENIELRTDSRFKWLLGDNVDTTTKSTNCPYDRFVVAGSAMQRASRNARVVDYQKQFNLNYDQTIDVSDHWPIAMEVI